MTWEERIREAAYTSPSGKRLTFLYDDVSRGFDKKTTPWEFPDFNGTFIQDLGHTGRRFPLRVFFAGPECDLEAAAFEDLLAETGAGLLEHPLYGRFNVVPTGSVTRKDNLKSGANVAGLEFELWESTGISTPSAQVDPAAVTVQAVEAYSAVAPEVLVDNVTAATVVGSPSVSTLVTLREQFSNAATKTKTTLEGVAKTVDEVGRLFANVEADLQQGLSDFIGDPLSSASQAIILVHLPARAATLIGDRLEAYRDLADSFIHGADKVRKPTLDNTSQNDFANADLWASTALTGAILSTVNNEFVTKADAISAAEFLLDFFGDLVDWRDQNFLSLGIEDTGGAYQPLQDAVAIAAGFLVEISFSLKQERRVTLDRARTPIDLVAEMYGAVDSELDFFLTSNGVGGDEIFELPMGREVVFYL